MCRSRSDVRCAARCAISVRRLWPGTNRAVLRACCCRVFRPGCMPAMVRVCPQHTVGGGCMRFPRRGPRPVERAGQYGTLQDEAHAHITSLLDARLHTGLPPPKAAGSEVPAPPDLAAAEARLSARVSSPRARARSWVLGSPYVPQRRLRVGKTLHIATPPYAGHYPAPADAWPTSSAGPRQREGFRRKRHSRNWPRRTSTCNRSSHSSQV